jgi:hypothetical protein
MDALDLLWHTDLRLSLAPSLTVVALWYAANGASMSWKALGQPATAPGKNVALMTGFRALITGTAVACVALGWLLHVPALIVVATVIGLGELLETSVDIYALRHSERWQNNKGRLQPRARGATRV